MRPQFSTRRIRVIPFFDASGLKNAAISATPSLRKVLKYEIVDAPDSPSGGKALKITIPGGNYRGIGKDLGYLRINVEFPDEVPAGTLAMMLDCKVVAAPGEFSRCNLYLNGEGKLGHRLYCYYLFHPGVKWQRVFNSTKKTETRPLKKITDAKGRTLSFFFDRITQPAEIWISATGDTAENISSAPIWYEGGEAEPI